MRLLLLGTAGYHPNDTRQTACLMIPEQGIVLDAGTGFYRVRDHLQTSELDIYLSHAHLDHVVGLTYWYDLIHQRQIDRATIHGEAEKLAALDEHLFSEHLFPARPPYQMKLLERESPLTGGGRLTHFPLAHPGGSVGFRLDWPGHSMAYVTDTTATADAPYLSHLRGVDLLVHECNFRDGEEELAQLTGHSCTTPVAQVAKQAGVGRLLLTHINPLVSGEDPVDLGKARAIFANTDVARDGMAVDF
jgi:ribonuclease Z